MLHYFLAICLHHRFWDSQLKPEIFFSSYCILQHVPYIEANFILGNCLICVTVLREPLTFIHQRTQCTGSQGPPGLSYSPPKDVMWPLQAGKAITGG